MACQSSSKVCAAAPLEIPKPSQAPNPFVKLPDEIIYEIFKLLTKKDLLIVGEVDRRFNKISYDNLLWEKPYQDLKRNFEIKYIEPTTYKSEYYKTLKKANTLIKSFPYQDYLNKSLNEAYKKNGNLFSVIKDYLDKISDKDLNLIFAKSVEVGWTLLVEEIIKMQKFVLSIDNAEKVLGVALKMGHTKMFSFLLNHEKVTILGPITISYSIGMF